MTEVSNADNIINVSDITARVDELRGERAEHDKENGTTRDDDGALNGECAPDDNGMLRASVWESECSEDAEELANLEKLLEDLEGCGRSHTWGGNTYPDMIISSDHFSEYVQEMAEDTGAVSRNSWVVVDWEATANGVRQDYRAVDFDGTQYWYRG
jgi:hypothetical protein